MGKILVQTSAFASQLVSDGGRVETVHRMRGEFVVSSPHVPTSAHVTVSPMPGGKLCVASGFPPVRITISESSTRGTGGSCWLSSVVLAALLFGCCSADSHVDDGPSRFLRDLLPKKRRILELGSGVGLGGIATALFCEKVAIGGDPAPRILLTDGDESVMRDLRSNAAANAPDASVLRLAWEDVGHAKAKADAVIACDCVYRSNGGDFVRAINNIIEGNGHVVMIYPAHREVDDVLYALESRGLLRTWTVDVASQLYGATAQFSVTVASLNEG